MFVNRLLTGRVDRHRHCVAVGRRQPRRTHQLLLLAGLQKRVFNHAGNFLAIILKKGFFRFILIPLRFAPLH